MCEQQEAETETHSGKEIKLEEGRVRDRETQRQSRSGRLLWRWTDEQGTDRVRGRESPRLPTPGGTPTC